MATILSMPPSAYLNRNVRVTPFYFEPIGEYLERYANLRDAYCYSTDYPHQEGGRNTKASYFAQVERFGSEMVEKFFVANGKWLLPD
jgi:hypothetical protein